MWWLKTTDIYSLITLLEARSPKLRCWQGCSPYGCSRGKSVPYLFQVLVTYDSLACGQISALSSHHLSLHVSNLPLPLSYL